MKNTIKEYHYNSALFEMDVFLSRQQSMEIIRQISNHNKAKFPNNYASNFQIYFLKLIGITKE